MTRNLADADHHCNPFQQSINAMFRGAGYHIGYMIAFAVLVCIGLYCLMKFVRTDGGADSARNRRNGRGNPPWLD